MRERWWAKDEERRKLLDYFQAFIIFFEKLGKKNNRRCHYKEFSRDLLFKGINKNLLLFLYIDNLVYPRQNMCRTRKSPAAH